MKKNPTMNGSAETVAAKTINHLSYSVKTIIKHHNDKNITNTLLETTANFSATEAITCRQLAFNYAHRLVEDVENNESLHYIPVDQPDDSSTKKLKNRTTYSIEINCDYIAAGKRMTISKGDFDADIPPAETRQACIEELVLYKTFGYETNSWDDLWFDENDCEFEVLDHSMEY